MAQARLTREESRARTRALVVEAAAKVFAARGFAAASMEEIAAEAGFTRGAVYSNFADKAELFLAVLEAREERRAAEVGAIYGSSENPGAFFAGLAAAEPARDADADEWLLLRLEFFLYAMRNESARPALRQRNRERIAALEPAIRGVLDAQGVEPPLPVEQVAQIIQALDDGMAMLHLVDPDGVRAELFFDTLGLLLDAATALDRERRGGRATARRVSPRRGARGGA